MTREEAIRILASSCIPGSKQTEALETLIPELRESEDERIRKEIYNFFKNFKETGTWKSISDVNTWLAYLEKQKDSASNNFDYVWDEEDCEEIIAEGQKLTPRFKELLKEVCHAWYDRGAKFEKQKEQKSAEWKATINGEPIPTENHSVNIPLAEWSEDDSDNLERVENYLWMLDDYVGDDCAMPQGKTDKIRENIQEILLPWLKSLPKRFNLQPKQEWSEEDEDTINLMIAILRENYSNCLFKTNSANTIRMSAISTDMLIKRIEALRPQPKQEWNEEDERMLSRCVKSIESSKQFADSDTFKKAKDNEIDWLENRIKSFRPVKQEWSKEDEKMLKWAIRIIVEYSDIDEEGSEIVQNWLESLRPQYHGDVTMTEAYKMGLEAGKASSWKPSKEQMDRLFSIVAALRKDYCDDMADFLANLYADLKKLGLKEEPEYYQHFDPDC